MPIQNRSTIKAWFESADKPTQAQFWDWLDSCWLKSEAIGIAGVSFGITTLVPVAGVVTWDVNVHGLNVEFTLNANTTLVIQNAQPGQFLLAIVRQDATGGRTITLPAGSTVGNNGGGAVALSAAANAKDYLTFFKETVGYGVLINQKFT